VPLPVPALVTVRANNGIVLNVAVTVWACDMLTEQPPVPLQAPLQPAKSEPLAGVAVKVTPVFWA